jgi:zinc protease
MRSSLSVLVALAVAAPAAPATIQAQAAAAGGPVPLTAKLPVDPKVRIGTLANGIHYYVRQNPKPEKRAELRLVVNAGSVLETDDQLGLAHFIEHMAFNGTTHFAKNDLVKYLQSIGVRFGADLNAYTGFDETVYILPIPTDTARIVDQAFTILEDWAHGQTDDSTEVANERGVVREEWRLGKGASDRMLHQWLPIALKGSLYAERLPIGNEQSIMTANRARVTGFYKKWYRPDLQAVIAVGDFDPAAIEAQIKKHFAGIPKPVNPAKRIEPTVPGNKEPLIAIASDKEATSSDVSVIYKLPVEKTVTVGDYKRDLMERLYMSMFNTRLAEIAQKPDAPFLGADASKGNFIGRSTDAFTLGAGVKDGEIEKGLEALLVEAKRVDEFGFLQSELDRAKQDMIRGYERAYAERDKTQSAALVQELIDNYLDAEPIPGIEYEYKIVQQLVPTIALGDVNKLASKWISDSNRVILAESPIKDGVKIPTRSDLLAVFERATKTKVVAYTENVSSEALVAKAPVPGTIVESHIIPKVDVVEWKLSNGARVMIKPTDFKADEVLFGSYSWGGTSLAPDADYMSAAMSSQIVGLSGIGNFNRIDLGKKLSGKVAGATGSISSTSEAVSGRASPKDLETMFQLVYLDFTAPRFDPDAYQAFKAQADQFLANKGSDPDAVFGDTVSVTMAQHAFRARPLTAATFAEVNPQKALAFYKDRFADASDFTFIIVGNVDTVSLKPLVTKYLASLPSIGRKETFKDNGITPPKGVVERVVHKGIEPKANTIIEFTGACTYNPATRVEMLALSQLLQIKLDETLREQLGGAYSPSGGGGCARVPRQAYDFTIEYNSSPENVDKLSKTVFAIIDTLKTQPASAADINKVKEGIIRQREVSLKQNAYWMTSIMSRDQNNEDLAGMLQPYDDLVKAIDANTIMNAAKKYLDINNYARFVLLPETKTTP